MGPSAVVTSVNLLTVLFLLVDEINVHPAEGQLQT